MQRFLAELSATGMVVGLIACCFPFQIGDAPAVPPADPAPQPVSRQEAKKPEDKPKPTLDPAVVALEKAKGSVAYDEKLPDRPVVGVYAPWNKGTDADFIKIASFKKLRELRIAQNSGIFASSITGAGFKDLAHLQDLESITASFCPITDEGVGHIVAFKKLKVLHFANAKFTDAGMKQLGTLQHLEEFSMYDVRQHGPKKDEPRDGTIALIGNFKNLRDLNLSYTDAGDETAKAIAGLPVKKLSMYLTKITDKGMADLAKLKLEDLHIGGYDMGDAGVAAFAGNTHMKSLQFSYASGVTDKSVKALSSMTGLTYLSLWMTSITPKGMDEIKKALPKCRVTR